MNITMKCYLCYLAGLFTPFFITIVIYTVLGIMFNRRGNDRKLDYRTRAKAREEG
jgi:hypothetical protein